MKRLFFLESITATGANTQVERYLYDWLRQKCHFLMTVRELDVLKQDAEDEQRLFLKSNHRCRPVDIRISIPKIDSSCQIGFLSAGFVSLCFVQVEGGQRREIADYMHEHPSFVEDLRIAASLVEKNRHILSESLRKRAEELAPYSPFDKPTPEFENPFSEEK